MNEKNFQIMRILNEKDLTYPSTVFVADLGKYNIVEVTNLEI